MRYPNYKVMLLLAGLIVTGSTASAYEGIHGTSHDMINVNYDSLFESATPLEQSPQGKALLEACLNKYGGVKALSEIRSLTLHYDMTLRFSKKTADVWKHVDTDRRHKARLRTAEVDIVRIINGGEAWKVVDDSLMILEGSGYSGQLFSYLTLNLPLSMQSEKYTEVKYSAPEGDSLAYIYMMKADSLLFVVGINPDDKLIREAVGVVYGPDGSLVYINRFADHKKYGEVLFPRTLVNVSMGLEVGTSILDTVIVNPELPGGFFRPFGPGVSPR